MTFVFKSIQDPNRRYRIYETDSENPAYDWTRCGGDHVSRYLSAFDTMGDGETQHAHDFLPTVELMPDVLESFILAIADIPADDLPDWLYSFWRHSEPERAIIEAVSKLKYKDTKRVFVNLETMKTSSADSKRHDRRWIELQDYYCGGSVDAITCLLNQDDCRFKAYSIFDRFGMLSAIETHLPDKNWELWEHLSKWSGLKNTDQDTIRTMFRNWQNIDRWYDAKIEIERMTRNAERLQKRIEDAALAS